MLHALTDRYRRKLLALFVRWSLARPCSALCGFKECLVSSLFRSYYCTVPLQSRRFPSFLPIRHLGVICTVDDRLLVLGV
jgi:hypothetical protein